MSDRDAGGGGEDVLSSIRRAVASRPERAGAGDGEAPDEDRLVLTPSQRVDRGHAEPAGESLFTDDDMLDEDALRALVAEMVREELTGVLGERITRNVRKLVRREINRALSEREID